MSCLLGVSLFAWGPWSSQITDNVAKGRALSHTHNVVEGGNFGAAAGLLEGAENCPQVDT